MNNKVLKFADNTQLFKLIQTKEQSKEFQEELIKPEWLTNKIPDEVHCRQVQDNEHCKKSFKLLVPIDGVWISSNLWVRRDILSSSSEEGKVL